MTNPADRGVADGSHDEPLRAAQDEPISIPGDGGLSSSRELSPRASVKVLPDLLARLEAAEGADRELDCYVEAFVSRFTSDGQFHIVGPPTYDPQRFFYNPLPSVEWIGYDLLDISPMYTASLDTSLALVERVLPEWLKGVQEWSFADRRPWVATLTDPQCSIQPLRVEAKTPALALLCALVKALIAEAATQ